MVREVPVPLDEIDLIEPAYLLGLEPNNSGSAAIGNHRWCTRSFSLSSADKERTIWYGCGLDTLDFWETAGGELGRVEGGLGVLLRRGTDKEEDLDDEDEVLDRAKGDWWIGA